MSVQQYTKKPVTIEAVQWDGTANGAGPIIDWILAGGGTARFHEVNETANREHAEIAIDTLEGVITASPGDWIIRGVQGEFYPCKPEIFEQTYSAAADAEAPTDFAALQRRVGAINEANGWKTGTRLREVVESGETYDMQRLTDHLVAVLALVTTEVSEAIEEIRAGRYPTEVYHSHIGEGRLAKPEGVPSELADVIIRVLDFANTWGIDLGAAVDEKLAYNATRGHRHGGKAI